MVSFGERLSKLRNENGLSQQDLADKINASKSSIGMYETNKREPDFTTLQKIADLFDVSIDFLMGRSDFRRSIPSNEPVQNEPIVQYIMRSKKEMTPEMYERWQELIMDTKKAFVERKRREEEEKGK